MAQQDKPTTSDLVIERLLAWNIDTCFGLCGDQINGFFESLRKHADRMRFVHVRHEENAALAAVGYAKFTGRPPASPPPDRGQSTCSMVSMTRGWTACR